MAKQRKNPIFLKKFVWFASVLFCGAKSGNPVGKRFNIAPIDVAANDNP